MYRALLVSKEIITEMGVSKTRTRSRGRGLLFFFFNFLFCIFLPFCSWMSIIHEFRRHSDVSRLRSLTHSLTHSILINLFIKSGLNNFLLPPLPSIIFVQECSVVFRRGGSRKAYILPDNSRAWVLVCRTPRRLKSASCYSSTLHHVQVSILTMYSSQN